MSVALDSNVLIALLAAHGDQSTKVADTLAKLSGLGALVVSAVVYAEILAGSGRRTEELDDVLSATRIRVAWDLDRSTWIHAGTSYGRYAVRRRQSGGGPPRRLLAGFLIGAHASTIGELLTFDQAFYRVNFPDLRVITPS